MGATDGISTDGSVVCSVGSGPAVVCAVGRGASGCCVVSWTGGGVGAVVVLGGFGAFVVFVGLAVTVWVIVVSGASSGVGVPNVVVTVTVVCGSQVWPASHGSTAGSKAARPTEALAL
ncbi:MULTISPECIES: hypothetical protein [unclassified Nonomuraea]|uniref:hypothetical protein n=1 Tax=unclassified Nonomuraea TaxID=2593643 RepID=UPI0033C87A3F